MCDLFQIGWHLAKLDTAIMKKGDVFLIHSVFLMYMGATCIHFWPYSSKFQNLTSTARYNFCYWKQFINPVRVSVIEIPRLGEQYLQLHWHWQSFCQSVSKSINQSLLTNVSLRLWLRLHNLLHRDWCWYLVSAGCHRGNRVKVQLKVIIATYAE